MKVIQSIVAQQDIVNERLATIALTLQQPSKINH